jgi:hypothetical protein
MTKVPRSKKKQMLGRKNPYRGFGLLPILLYAKKAIAEVIKKKRSLVSMASLMLGNNPLRLLNSVYRESGI